MIIKIERFALHDGPGIRTVIFLKGCPLRCAWCSNPESQSLEGQVFYKPERELVGKNASVEDIMYMVMKDCQYYSATSGGITLSGGEPFFQPVFAQEILKACKAENIHTAVETSGFVKWEDLEKALPDLDLVLFDLKHPDPERHRLLTGVENQTIVANLGNLALRGIPVIARIPLVPTYNDSPGVLADFASILQSMRVETIHLLPYHRMGIIKYGWLGRSYDLPEVKTHTEDQLAAIQKFFDQRGFVTQIGG